jgi:tetratricopeptide (TPR) repeat protein
MNNLGLMYKNAGEYDRALPLLRNSLEIARRRTGDEDRRTLGRITNLGLLYYEMGRYDDARKMYETSLPIKRRILGENDPWTWIAIRGLARTYDALGRSDDALPLHREYVELLRAAADAPDAAPHVLNKCANALLTHEVESLRDPSRALKLAQAACTTAEATGNENLWMYLDILALAQHRTGDTAAAVETQRRAVEIMPNDADPEMAERLAEYEAALVDEDNDLAGKGGDQ